MTDQLPAAAAAVDCAADVVASATDHLARESTVDGRISVARLDEHQVLGYDLAHAASAVEGAKVMLAYGEQGEVESPTGARVHRRRDRRSRRQAPRPRGGLGRRRRAPRAGTPVRRGAPRPRVPRDGGRGVSTPAAPGPATSPTTSSSRPRRSTASPRRRSARSPSTSTAPTPTSPRRSSPGSPSSAASGSRCPRSTAASRPAARPTTSAWSSPPRSCRGARSASAGRSSPAPRSSPGPSWPAAPRSRSSAGSPASPPVSSWSA